MENSEKLLFVGIDTSNYTTSCALCNGEGRVLANIKRMLPVKLGERGLRQSDAVFHHTRNLPLCMQELREAILPYIKNGACVAAVGYSGSPRDNEGSYMPCFLTGEAAAYSFVASLDNIKLYKTSHQCGHIRAALYSSGHEEIRNSMFGAFHVSGGTTDLLLCKPFGTSFLIERVGGSLDINAGQAIDRTGVNMGLGFPSGKEMEGLAFDCNEKIKGISVSVTGMDCNLSGLENKALGVYKKTNDKAYTSAYVFEFVGKTLYEMSCGFIEKYGNIPIIYAGGVMSNKRIKEKLQTVGNVYFAEPEFSSDNAAGVALLAYDRYMNEEYK